MMEVCVWTITCNTDIFAIFSDNMRTFKGIGQVKWG